MPLDADADELFKVECLLDHRDVKKGRKIERQFLVKWAYFDAAHNSWEPEENLKEGASEALDEYFRALAFKTGAALPRKRKRS